MTTQTLSARGERFSTCLHAFFVGDFDTFLSMYGDDAVPSFPFAPEGMPSQVKGKTAITAWMKQVPDMVEFDGSVNNLRITEGADRLTAEWTSTGRFPTGEPAIMSYVAVVAFEGDLVTDYRDYMNPLQLQPALDH